MPLRICPECDKAFFMPFWNESAKCPHCGVFFAERRTSKRHRKEIPVTLSLKGAIVKATTTDISDYGAGILISGCRLERNALFELTIDEIRTIRRARAVWTKQENFFTSAGIKLL